MVKIHIRDGQPVGRYFKTFCGRVTDEEPSDVHIFVTDQAYDRMADAVLSGEQEMFCSVCVNTYEDSKGHKEPAVCPLDQIHLTAVDVPYSVQVLHSDKPNLVELRLWPAGNRPVLEFKTNKVFAARLAAVLNFVVKAK